MKKKILIGAMSAILAIPMTASAVQVAGKTLEIYGKLHVSVDATDNDRAAPNDESDFTLSTNSSRLGFKGKHKIGNSDLTVVYKLEQQIDIGLSGGTAFNTRNTFVGLKGSFGQVIAGYHDTPFKTVASKWGVFGDTVGERRALLGAKSTGGNTMNQRARNMLMWSNKFGNMKAMVMYSGNTGTRTGNDYDTMKSVGLLYKGKGTPFYFGAAYEDWDSLKGSATDGYRIMGGYKASFGKIGLIYEDISSNDTTLDRSAFGINGVVKLGSGLDLRGQILIADDSAAGANTGATMTTLGLYKKLDKKTKLYAVYTQMDNDSNAAYQGVDGGHGVEVKTDSGATPTAFSLGMIYKF